MFHVEVDGPPALFTFEKTHSTTTQCTITNNNLLERTINNDKNISWISYSGYYGAHFKFHNSIKIIKFHSLFMEEN